MLGAPQEHAYNTCPRNPKLERVSVHTFYFFQCQDKHVNTDQFLSYFFVKKKIPLSRRVEYVMDGSTDQGVSERCMYVTPIRSDLL